MTSTMLNSENPYFNCNIKNVCDVCAVCIRTLQTNEFPLDKVISEQTMYIEKKVYEILEAFSNFKLHDNGPQYLCATCYKNTVSVYKFQQLCNKTYALFLEYSMYNDNILEGSTISEDQIENKLNTEVIEIKNDEKHETKVVTATSKRRRRQRPKFKCPVCHKIITGWNIKLHMRVHTGEKPYKCTHCDAAFSQSFTLNIHIKRHENIKTCICTFCGKGFVDKSGLKQHEETHSELKSYKCQQCEKSFNTKRALLSHNIVHAKDKRFTCEYCAKSYPRKKTLVLHLRSHTGEKPHLCTKCGKRFTQMHSLRSHLQRHQRDSMDRALKYTEECEIATS